MNKGQSKIWVVLGFIFLITAFVLVIIVFRAPSAENFNTSPTGDVVTEIEKTNYINPPFELRAWVINPNGIQLDVKNLGSQSAVIRDFSIEGCGRSDRLGLLNPEESGFYEFSCSVPGPEFEGKIRIQYSLDNSNDVLSAEGFIKDFV